MNKITRSSYKEEVTQYTRKDAIHALLFVTYLAVLTFGSSILMIMFDVIDGDGQMTFAGYLLGMGLALLTLAPLVIIVKKKGQGLDSLGLHLADWKKSLFVGLFFAIVFLMLFRGLLPGLLAGWQIRSPIMILWTIVYLLIMAIREDIVFVGYIQTRIYGLIKRDFLATVTVGALFAVLHYPGFIALNILAGDGFRLDFWFMLAGMTLSWVMGHILFNVLFRQFRSIIVVILFHSSSNLAMRGDLWAYSGESDISPFFIISGGIAFGAFLLITVILPNLKKRKKKQPLLTQF